MVPFDFIIEDEQLKAPFSDILPRGHFHGTHNEEHNEADVDYEFSQSPYYDQGDRFLSYHFLENPLLDYTSHATGLNQ